MRKNNSPPGDRHPELVSGSRENKNEILKQVQDDGNLRKTILIFTLLFIPLFFGLLVGPRAPDSLQVAHCYTNISLIKPFGISLNCDSTDFLSFAHDPAKLLEAKNVRQSRPGYIVLGYLVSYVFQPVSQLIAAFSPTAAKQNHDMQYRIKNWSAAYMAFMLIHFVILLLSTVLIIRTTDDDKPQLSTIFIALFPLFNLLTKSCFFSPHTQLFNILTPILCYWAALRTWQGRLFGNKLGYLTIFLAGLGITAYATFFLVLPAILGPAFIIAIRDKKLWHFVGHAFLTTCLIMLPSVLWLLFVTYKTGAYYHHEYEGGQVAWFLQEQSIITKFIMNSYQIAMSGLKQSLPYALIGLVVCVFAIRQKIAPRILIALYVSLLFTGLLSIMNFYPERLTFTLIPAWWCVIAYLSTQTKQSKIVNILIPAAILIWAGVIVWLDSPTTCA